MPNFLRSQTFPYAGSSTGPYRGLMARKYPCWDAQGPARDLFTGEIAGKIKACLEQCLPESNSFVGFSLFMVGKLPEKTKPTIMIVSDDKSCRKAAFQIVKSKNMLTAYPGFELGHCSVAAEFEDLRQLGSGTTSSPSSVESNDFDGDLPSLDDLFEPGAKVRSLLSAEVCAFEPLNYKEPTRLYFHMSQKSHSHTSATATCGGLIIFEQRPYALTMAHAIDPIRRAIVSPEPHSDSSSQSDDFEITGMDDWDEGDEEDTKTLTAITSPGSKTPSELSDSEESLLRPYDSHLSSEVDIRTQTATGPSIIYEEDYIDDRDNVEDEMFELEVCERIGSVVSIDEVLDIAVIKVTQNGPNSSVSNFINGHLLIELLTTDSPTKTSITIKTTHHAEIRGQRSEMPFYTRLPGKIRFLELFSAQLSTALHPGDSGSWAFGDNGELIGFVVAGNPQTRSCLLLPSKPALQSVWSLLSNRGPPRRNRSARTVNQLQLDTRDFNDTTPDEDSMTAKSSLPPPSIFSLRMDRGATPSTVARSTTTMFYESRPDLSLARGSLSGGDAGLATSAASNGKFLEEQAYRLRRELERAWEIIQEKDKRLQEFGIGNPDEDLNYGAQYTAPSLSKDIGDVQLGFGLGSGLKRRTWSSPPLWEPEVSPLEDLRESNLERPFDFEFSLKGRPKTVEPYLEIDRRNVEDLRNTWQREVDTNYALRKENRELRGGIKQAIEAIHQVNGDGKEAEGHGELVKIATELRRVLHDSGDSGSLPGTVVNVKPEPELNEINLRDIPPFPQEPQGLLNSIPKLPPRQRPHKERRTLTPKGQFHRLSRVPKGHSTSLPVYESKIKTVPEEDEDDEMEDRAATKVENHAREEVKGKDNMLLSPTSTSSRPHDWVQPETAPNLDSDYSPISPRMVLSMNISQDTPDLNFHEGAVQHILESSMSDTTEKAPSSSSGKKNEETDDRLTIQEKKDEHEVN